MVNLKKIVPITCTSYTEQSRYLCKDFYQSLLMTDNSVAQNELNTYQESNSIIDYRDEENAQHLRKKYIKMHENFIEVLEASQEDINNRFKSLLEETKDLSINLDNISNSKYAKIHEFFDIDKITFAENTLDIIDLISGYIEEGSYIDLAKSLCYRISGSEDVTDIKEMQDMIYEELIGNIISIDENILINHSDKFDDILTTSKVLDDINESFDKQKTAILAIIESIKDLDESELDTINTWNYIATLAESTMISCYYSTYDAFNRMIHEYRNAVAKINSKPLEETSLLRSRKMKLSFLKRKMFGNSRADNIKKNKSETKHDNHISHGSYMHKKRKK